MKNVSRTAVGGGQSNTGETYKSSAGEVSQVRLVPGDRALKKDTEFQAPGKCAMARGVTCVWRRVRGWVLKPPILLCFCQFLPSISGMVHQGYDHTCSPSSLPDVGPFTRALLYSSDCA